MADTQKAISKVISSLTAHHHHHSQLFQLKEKSLVVALNHTEAYEPLRRLSKPAREGKVFCLKIDTAKKSTCY